MKGDSLVSLINRRTDEAPVREFLTALREEPSVRPDWVMTRIRYIFLGVGVVVVESATARVVVALYLHAPGVLSSAGYTGELPCGLSFSLTREQVRERMQSPHYSGYLGPIAFDGWLVGGCMIRVAYTSDGRISFIALLPWREKSLPRSRQAKRPAVESQKDAALEPIKPGHVTPGVGDLGSTNIH
jgi:hypothetical protein